MKNHGRSFTGLCAVLLAVLVLVPLTAADLNGDTYLLTTIDKLRIRTSPKLDGQVIRTMEKGEKLVLLGVGKTAAIDGMSGPWLKVLTESYGTYGWVYGPYVKQSDEAIPYGDNIPFTDNVSPIFFGLGSNNDQFNVWQDKLQIPAMAARKAEILTVHEGRRLIAQHSLEPGKLVTSAEILLDLGSMKAGTHVLEFTSWRGGAKIAGRELVLEVFKRTSKTITKGDSPDFSYAVKAMNCTLRSLFRTVPGEEGPYPVPDFNRYLLELPLDYRMEIQLKEDPNITDIYQLPLELKLYRQNLIVTRQLMKLWDLSGGADMVFAEQGVIIFGSWPFEGARKTFVWNAQRKTWFQTWEELLRRGISPFRFMQSAHFEGNKLILREEPFRFDFADKALEEYQLDLAGETVIRRLLP